MENPRETMGNPGDPEGTLGFPGEVVSGNRLVPSILAIVGKVCAIIFPALSVSLGLKRLFSFFSLGKSFICLDDKNNKNLIKNLKHKNFYTYGLDPKSNFCIKNIKQFRE